MKPRVLYVITLAERAGAQNNVLELMKGFRGRFDLMLAVGQEGYLTEAARGLGAQVRVLPSIVRSPNPLKDFAAVRDLRGLMAEFRPDLVHAHSSKAGIVARAAAWLAGVPALFTAHGWGFTEGVAGVQRRLALLAEWLVGRLGAGVIVISRYDHDLALRYRVASRRQMHVVHLGISDDPVRADPGASGPVRLTMVARFSEQKDQATLIRAVQGLEGDYRVQLVGDGPLLEPCQRLAAELGVLDRVEFMGLRGDVPELLAGSHAFVLATNYEGFPVSILEAMRAGLPVVASAVSGIPEEVLDGQTGLLAPPQDAPALRERLARLIADPALRGRLGAEGRQVFAERYTVGVMLASTLAVYQSRMRESTPAPGGQPR